MDRGAWQDTVHGITKKSDTTVQLNFTFNFHVADIVLVIEETVPSNSGPL